MPTDRKEQKMKFDLALVIIVAAVWALLASAYALAPWEGMIGYAWVWGFGALLFAGLALLLRRASLQSRAARAKVAPGGAPRPGHGA
jgi:hypothetical protein